MIVIVIRTRMPFFQSKPGRYLVIATLLLLVMTLGLPFTPLAGIFGFRPLPRAFLFVLGFIVAFYSSTGEILKRVFYQKVKL